MGANTAPGLVGIKKPTGPPVGAQPVGQPSTSPKETCRRETDQAIQNGLLDSREASQRVSPRSRSVASLMLCNSWRACDRRRHCVRRCFTYPHRHPKPGVSLMKILVMARSVKPGSLWCSDYAAFAMRDVIVSTHRRISRKALSALQSSATAGALLQRADKIVSSAGKKLQVVVRVRPPAAPIAGRFRASASPARRAIRLRSCHSRRPAAHRSPDTSRPRAAYRD